MRALLDLQCLSSNADTVASLFKPSYSVIGSNRRAKEELVVVRFKDFLQCIESKYTLSVNVDTKCTSQTFKIFFIEIRAVQNVISL